MANEQYAVLKKSAVPTRDQWQAAIEAGGGCHAVTRRSRGSACTPGEHAHRTLRVARACYPPHRLGDRPCCATQSIATSRPAQMASMTSSGVSALRRRSVTYSLSNRSTMSASKRGWMRAIPLGVNSKKNNSARSFLP